MDGHAFWAWIVSVVVTVGAGLPGGNSADLPKTSNTEEGGENRTSARVEHIKVLLGDTRELLGIWITTRRIGPVVRSEGRR